MWFYDDTCGALSTNGCWGADTIAQGKQGKAEIRWHLC
jgi:hypothetical protein